jgi:outer membrane immunogenic protein
MIDFCVSGAVMKKLATAIAAIALIGTPAFAADMAVKAPPPGPAPAPTWTGFYGGIQFGGGWSDETVSSSPNDPLAATLLSGSFGIVLPGEQPVATSLRLNQSGAVGGFEAGYNWQLGSNWLVGLETDFSAAGLNGQASGTSILETVPLVLTQSINAQTTTDWYGTVRGRLGWLATPSLLLFGTGGFAYGRVGDSANYTFNGVSGPFAGVVPGFSFLCVPNTRCFSGTSSSIRTGWVAGGGVEWLLDQHWSAKIEYQFIDLGTDTVRITATPCPVTTCAGATPPSAASSFNSAFHDRFNVVRLGLNYRFW